MEEKKEKKIIGFDDSNMEKEWERVLRETRESKKLDDEFLKIIVKRIREGITTYQHELNSLPEKYRKKFNLLYENSKKNKNT